MNATLNPNVLRWARNKAGLTEDDLAASVGVNLGLVKEWEKTRTAFGYLFLEQPPIAIIPIADFRRIDDAQYSTPSEELLEVIYDAQLKQKWYRKYMLANGEKPLPFIGKHSLKSPVKDTADCIRTTLGIGPELAKKTTKWEDTIRCTTEATEEKGILVLRAGYVGATSRTLAVEEFRGFALFDKYAPLIFINGADAPAAQIFTIAHEIAHIWVGKTGVSNLERTYSTGNAIERYCNSVAAEVLLPLDEIESAWAAEVDDVREINRLSDEYKISRIVVARRAHDAKLLTDEKYNSYYRMVVTSTPKSSGGQYYINESIKIVRSFHWRLFRRHSRGELRNVMQCSF